MSEDRVSLGQGIVLYDFLHCQGGAERVTLGLLDAFPEADLCIAYRDREQFRDNSLPGRRIYDLGLPARFPGGRTLIGGLGFRLKPRFLNRYAWALFSGTIATEAVHWRPAGSNLYYCHTLPRYAYDLLPYYQARIPWLLRPLFRLLVIVIRWRYASALGRMDLIVANSENVRRRLARYVGASAHVVYPPCDVSAFTWQGQADYYLSTARLEPHKRVDQIIKAFLGMPDRRLIIVSGGRDEQRLRRLAIQAPNIEFTGWATERQLRNLVGRCIATLYVPRDEDFGLSPIESMAAGKPVIGVAEGGLLETVIPGQTGILIADEPTPGRIAAAVRELTPPRARQMREACLARAAQFSKERFEIEMRALVHGLTHQHQ